MAVVDDKFTNGISIRTSNVHEVEICRELEEAGYEVIKNGWPDFIAVKGNRLLLIEVKPPWNRTGLSTRQRKVARIFKRFFGIKVHCIRPGDPIPRGFREP